MQEVRRKAVGRYYRGSQRTLYVTRCKDKNRCLSVARRTYVRFQIAFTPECSDSAHRQSTTDTQRENQENAIITIVRLSLVDDEAIVRTAAAKAFDILQEQLGSKAVDQTIPTLLEALRQPGESSGTALQALKEVMNVSLGYITCRWSKLMSDSGPCSHRVPDSHPYPHCKPYDTVQRPRSWVSRGCGRKCSQPKAYRYRRSSCPRIGDHYR